MPQGLIPGNCQRVPAAEPDQKCGVQDGRALALPATDLGICHTLLLICA